MYELVTPLRASRSGCASVFGKFMTCFYIFLQLVYLLLIYVSLTHQTIVLFSMPAWYLMVLQTTLSLIIAIVVYCAYFFDVEVWTTFKSALNFVWALQLGTHLGLPAVLVLLRVLATQDEDKAIYETSLMIFGLLALIDTLVLVGMLAPYYCLYEETGTTKIEVEMAERPRWARCDPHY